MIVIAVIAQDKTLVSEVFEPIAYHPAFYEAVSASANPDLSADDWEQEQKYARLNGEGMSPLSRPSFRIFMFHYSTPSDINPRFSDFTFLLERTSVSGKYMLMDTAQHQCLECTLPELRDFLWRCVDPFIPERSFRRTLMKGTWSVQMCKVECYEYLLSRQGERVVALTHPYTSFDALAVMRERLGTVNAKFHQLDYLAAWEGYTG